MRRWGARSSGACYSPPPRPCFSCRPYSRSFTGVPQSTRFTLWRFPMAEESTGTDTNLRRKVHRYGLILLIVALCLALWGEVSRILARSALAKQTTEAAIPTVWTTTPNRTTLGEELVLPGTVQA